MEQIVVAAIGPIVTALLAALGFWLRERRLTRNSQRAYQQALDDANAQTTFIHGWLDTQKQLASPEEYEQARARALADLQQAYVRVEQTRETVNRQGERVTIRRIGRRLLLLDSMHTTTSRLLGSLYYLSLVWLMVSASVGALLLFIPLDDVTGSAAGDLAIGGAFFVTALGMGLAPTILLYWLVVVADRRTENVRRKTEARRRGLVRATRRPSSRLLRPRQTGGDLGRVSSAPLSCKQ